MNKSRSSFPIRGNYINGQFRFPSEVSEEIVCRSPADTTDELATVPVSYPAIQPSLQGARSAFDPWRKTALAKRRELLSRLKEQLLLRQEPLAEVMARELGRPLWDGKQEIQQGLRLIEAWESRLSETRPNVTTPSQGMHERRRSRGVFAIITPFSLPLVTPLGHLLPSLLFGNTVVWKPSEKAAVLSQMLAECFESAELPAGVFNMVQGNAEMGRRLCNHEGIDAILFTGAYEVANRIKQETLHHHWKLLVTECGGKNTTLVWKPEDLEKALYPVFVSAYLSAGQRPTTSSRIFVENSLLDRFIERFHERAKAFSIGHPLENPFMGPLVDSTAVDRYMKFMGIASREGAEIIMRGKTLDMTTPGYYVAPSICTLKNPTVDGVKKSVYLQSELSGPNVSILGVGSLDEAIQLANTTSYGLIASVFTKDRSNFDHCAEELQFAQVHWNVPTTDPHALLPGSGLKKSGNHFVTGIRSEAQCQVSVFSLEREETEHFHGDYPGLQWK